MKQVNKGGRPSKFTAERRAAILDSISHCIPYELAALANGICEDTLYDWLKHGLEDISAGIDSEFAKFSEALKKIEEEKIKYHLQKINRNIERWQADAWILERRWSKLFSANAPIREMQERLDKLEKFNQQDKEI